MRTYSRTPKEDKLIEDVYSLCRLCLSKAKDSVPIFREGNAYAALPMRIMSCLGFELKQVSYLPDKICTSCLQELERYYKFRRKCEDSYMKLKSHVAAIMLMERINKLEVTHRTNDNIDIDYDKEKDNQPDEMEQLVITDICSIEEHREEESVPEDTLTMDNDDAHEDDVRLEEKDKETSEIQAPLTDQSNEVTPDISTFLNAILVELGILARSEDGLTVQERGVASLQLETGEGDQLLFELVEEDESRQSTVASTPKVTHAQAEDDAEIKQYVTEKKRKNLKNMGAWCDVCARTFASVSAARRHATVHSGARPYACPECGRAFAQRAVMQRHRLVHAAERPFKCGECAKSFTQRGALARHAMSHAPHARPLALHACARCRRVFLYASGLSRHMLTHAGRTFPCVLCARLFNDKSSLARHTRTTHPQPH